MQPCVLPLALLFIAFTIPSDAQNSESGGAVSEAPGAGAGGGAGAESSTAEPFADQPKTLVKYELGSKLVFNCTPAMPASGTYQWLKNGTLVDQLRDLKGRHAVDESGATLTVPRAYENDFGNYTCLVGGEFARAWQAAARLLAKLPSDASVVEGQKWTLTCKLLGRPYERVAWLYAPAEGENATELLTAGEGAEGGRWSTRDSPAGVPGGVLELAAAERADAGVYTCAPPGGVADRCTLRVKDVYAALWPFLGICLEVFVLCAIILVYEKRRTKPELDDSDADTHDQ